MAERNITVAVAVDVGREHMNVVSVARQGPAKRVYSLNRAAISYGRQIGRDDVKKAQMLDRGLAVRPNPIA